MASQQAETEQGEPEPKASPWNSLEVSKLLLSALTPIAIFLLGLWLTLYSHSREDEIRTEANEQEDRIREDARVKAARSASLAKESEALLRDQNRREEARIRGEAVATERALRAESFGRELRMRRESDARAERVQRDSDAREATLRREASQQARLTRILDKRIETWARAAPQLRRFHGQLFDLYRMVLRLRRQGSASNQEAAALSSARREADVALQEFEELIVPFEAFFSDAFRRAQSCFISNSGLLLMQLAAFQATEEPFRAAWNGTDRAYYDLLLRARLDVREDAVSHGPPGNVTDCPMALP